MSLVVRIRADISALSQGFQQAIQAADAFEQKLSNFSTAGAYGKLVADMQQVSKGLGGAGLKIHAFAKDAAVSARGLTTATANLTQKLGPLATALDKATNSMSQFSQTARSRLPQATQAIQNFSTQAQAAITPITGAFNAMGAGARQAASATNALNRTSSAMGALGSIVTENTSLWTRFGVALGGALIGSMVSQVFWRLGDALLRLPGLMVELAGSLEQTKIALNTMVGEGDKATKFLKDLQQFAIETPFEFEGLMKSAKMLMAMGINSKAVLPILRKVGDAVAAVGGGTYQIENVSRALAQMAAKGKLNAEEMGQLAENGIPAVDMLAKKLGVTSGKIMEMAEKSQLAAAKYLPILINELGVRFPNMMEKQNKTITGSLAMLSDAFKLTVGEIGKRLIELTGLTDKVRALASAFMALGTAVREQGLPGLFSAAFGKNSQNFVNGLAIAIGAVAASAGFMGIKILTSLPILAEARKAMIAMSIATLKETAILGGIAIVAYSVGVNLKWLGERAGRFADVWYSSFYLIGQQMANFAQVVWSSMKAAGSAITGDFASAKSSLDDVAKGLETMVSDAKSTGADIKNALSAPLKESFVNPLTEAGKAWAAFSSMFNEKSNGVKLGAEKVTTAMMGIAAGIDPAKTKDMSAKLERAANQAMATANAYTALKTNLEGIIAKEIELGYAYDENRAIADALSPVISALTAQYGRKDKQVQELIKTQQLYRKLSIEVSQVEQRRFTTMTELITVGTNLGNALKLISEEAENNGEAYNKAEAQAKAYKNAIKSLGAIKISDPLKLSEWAKKADPKIFASLGKDIPAAIAKAIKAGDAKEIEKALYDLMAKATADAQEFDVSQIIDNATKSFDLSRRTALSLGKSFDEVAERTNNITEQIVELTKKGTAPALREIERLKKELEMLQGPMSKVAVGLLTVSSGMQAVMGVLTSSLDLLATFGVNINETTKAVIEFGTKFISALSGIGSAFGTLLTTFNTFSAAFAANPWLVGILAIVAGIGLAIGATMAWRNAESERAAQSTKFQKEYLDNLREIDAKLTATNMAAMEAFENRGEVVRLLTNAEMEGVLALIDRYDELNWQLSMSEGAASEALASIRDEIKRTSEELNAILPAATQTAMGKSSVRFQSALSRWQRDASVVAAEAAAKISNSLNSGIIDSLKSAGRAFLEGAQDWQYKLRQGIRDAVISGIVDAMVKQSIIDVIMPDVKNLADTLQKGRYVDPSQVEAIFAKADRLGGSLERLLGPVRDVITGFKVEAPKFNEAFSGMIEGANSLMNSALASGDVVGIGRAAAQFQAAQAGAYGSQYNDITINYQGRGTGFTEQDARELGQKIVDQLRRAGKG